MPGDSYSASSSETDASALISGNTRGSSTSADRVSQQFLNIGGGANALDLNSYLGATNAGFYQSIAGEQRLESAPQSNAFKYTALGAAVFVSLAVVLAMRGRK